MTTQHFHHISLIFNILTQNEIFGQILQYSIIEGWVVILPVTLLIYPIDILDILHILMTYNVTRIILQFSTVWDLMFCRIAFIYIDIFVVRLSVRLICEACRQYFTLVKNDKIYSFK
jgi:hypothetical protein